MGKGPVGHYHDTVPFAKNNFAKAAKSAASKCNIERHPLLETASRNHRPTRSGTPRYGVPDAPLVNSSLSSALGSGDQAPLYSTCPYVARRLLTVPTQPHRRLRPHPPRHHHHLGVQPPPRFEQPLDHLRRVQIRQTVVEHDQRRLHPTDLEQRVHARRRLHHLQIQIRPLDRQHQRLEITGIVVHHHHHVVPVRPLELRGHPHLVRLEEGRQILRLHTPPSRRGLVSLQQPLVDPVGHRCGRDLTDARHALRTPVSLVLWQTHRTPT